MMRRPAASSAEMERIRLMAETDLLTGLPNRDALYRKLESSFSYARSHISPIGIGIVDVDLFNKFNDRYGVNEGDRCLYTVANLMKSIAGDDKIFCSRYGGDEFVLIYEDMEKDAVCGKAELLGREIEFANLKRYETGIEGIVTISQAICYGVPENKMRIWDFMSEANRALRYIKQEREDGDSSWICVPPTSMKFSYAGMHEMKGD